MTPKTHFAFGPRAIFAQTEKKNHCRINLMPKVVNSLVITLLA